MKEAASALLPSDTNLEATKLSDHIGASSRPAAAGDGRTDDRTDKRMRAEGKTSLSWRTVTHAAGTRPEGWRCRSCDLLRASCSCQSVSKAG